MNFDRYRNISVSQEFTGEDIIKIMNVLTKHYELIESVSSKLQTIIEDRNLSLDSIVVNNAIYNIDRMLVKLSTLIVDMMSQQLTKSEFFTGLKEVIVYQKELQYATRDLLSA